MQVLLQAFKRLCVGNVQVKKEAAPTSALREAGSRIKREPMVNREDAPIMQELSGNTQVKAEPVG